MNAIDPIYKGNPDRGHFPRTIQTGHVSRVTPGGERQYRTCMELGLCQTRNPACSGCDWKIGPRTFDSRRQRRRARLIRRIGAVAGILFLLFLASFLAGFFLRQWGIV